MVWLESLEEQEGMLTDVIQGRSIPKQQRCDCATLFEVFRSSERGSPGLAPAR